MKKNKKRNKKSNKKSVVIKIIILIIVLLLFSIYGYYYIDKYITPPTPLVTNVEIDENNMLVVKYSVPKYKKNKDIYCIFKNENKKPDINDKDWKLAKNNECKVKVEDKIYYGYLKNAKDEIFSIDDTKKQGKILTFNVNKKQIYIAVNGKYKLKSSLDAIGNIDKTINWSSDNEDIAKVDQTGLVTGLKVGNTVVHARVEKQDIKVNVMVTNLITVRPKNYNNKKPYLPCGKYNKEENDILDTILKDRINDAGYKTRAGAVEAARFLALEFPYKIRYFSENGRGSTNQVDGEGRYYHVGLYLDKSRFSGIKKRLAGPQTWGCQLYSRPSKGKRMNGLDCSGFVSWVLLNGGFDVGDIGAGLAPHLDLTDYGVRTRFNADIVKSNKVKVGDLLSSGGINGGHIAIIAGEDDNYYYVAESLWTPPNVAVIIKPYSKKNIFERYFYVMFMDSYYKEDGNLTKLWY